MKPIIGILAEVNTVRSITIQDQYIRAIERSGGVPIILPYVKGEQTLEEFVRVCDGLLFSGGADVAPERYGEQKKPTCEEPQYYRDELEFAILEKAICTSLPILAICRGAQLVNVAFGGTLYQDLPSELPTDIPHRQSEEKFAPSHDVRIIDDTPLCRLAASEYMMANSFHHQAVKALGRGLETMAVADDGIIEAFYLTGEQYVRGYQWHPERLFDIDEKNRLIFAEFIDACRSDNL